MKKEELTDEQLDLVDHAVAHYLANDSSWFYNITAPNNEPRQRAILKSVKINLSAVKADPSSPRDLLPSQPMTTISGEVIYDDTDIAIFAMTHPHLAANSDAERARIVQRLENQGQPEDLENPYDPEEKVDSFIRNLEAHHDSLYPNIGDDTATHFLKTGRKAHLYRHLDREGDDGQGDEILQHSDVDREPAITLIMRVKRRGQPFWLVRIHGGQINLETGVHKFYLYEVQNPANGGDINFKQILETPNQYGLADHNDKDNITSLAWEQQPVDKVYEEHFDGTYRVSIMPEGFTKPVGQFMEKAYEMGMRKILEFKKKEISDELMTNLKLPNYTSTTGIPGLAMAYHLPENGGAFRVLISAPMRIIDALPEENIDRGEIAILITKQRLENARNIIKHLDQRVAQAKKTHNVAPDFSKTRENKNLESVWKMFAANSTAWQQKPLKGNKPYLFLTKDYKLVSSAIYQKIYKHHNPRPDSEIVKEYEIDNIAELRRTFWILEKSPASASWKKGQNSDFKSDIATYIRYPNINLVEKNKKPNLSNSNNNSAKKFGPQKKNIKQMDIEEKKVADSSSEKKEKASKRGQEIADWWSDQFSFKETRKAFSESHSFEKDKGFWEGAGATVYDYFWTKVDFRQVTMDALACLMNGQIGQSINSVMNDFNVLKGEYDEWSDYFGSDEWTSKTTGEKWESIPAFFYPDDLPIDDFSAEFIQTLREGVSSLINQLMLTAAQGILDSLINFCERPNVDIPDPTDRVPTPDFNFDRLGELIDALYEGLVTPEELSNLLEDLATQLSPLELCALLEGNAPGYVLDKAMEVVRLHCIDWIQTEDQLVNFFASIGDNLDLSVCDDIRALEDKAPIDEEYLCPPDRTITRRILGEKGLSDKEIEKQLEEQRQKRRDQAEALMDALKNGILSGNFEVPNVFCQKDEQGNVKKGSVSFFDDQFKYVTKETVEHIFASTYNNFQSEGSSFPQSLMIEEQEMVSCAPYTRLRNKECNDESGNRLDIVGGTLDLVSSPFNPKPSCDHYPGDIVIGDAGGNKEQVVSNMMISDTRKPFPYLVKFYNNPNFSLDYGLGRQPSGGLTLLVERIQIPFAFNFLSQLEGMANQINNLREGMSNTSRASNREDCDTSDDAADLQELIDNISSGINENSKSTHVVFEQRYDNRTFLTTPLDCASYGEGLVYDPVLEDCKCDEGYKPDPENPGKCIKIVVQQQENPIVQQEPEDRCEPPLPGSEVVQPPSPPDDVQPEEEQQEVSVPSDEKQVQYSIKITGNDQYPTTQYTYEKKVPDQILDYIESRNTSDYSASTVFKFTIEDIIEQGGASREVAEKAAEILLPSDFEELAFHSQFKHAIISELFGILGGAESAPYMRKQQQFSAQGPPTASKDKYLIEHLNLGPMPNDVCDPHLLKIRQVLEDMFDELGDNLCLDLHAEKNLDEDGLPRLKPLEEAAMSACIKVTLRHYLIENITRGLITHSTFLKIGDAMSDLKYGYIFGKMKLAMESYGETYYKNFCKYALKVYKGPKLNGKGPKAKQAIIQMMKREYREISYGLHQALFLGEISSGRRINPTRNFFVNMFNDITRDNRITIFREVVNDLQAPFLAGDVEEVQFFQTIYEQAKADLDFGLMAHETGHLMSWETPYRCVLGASIPEHRQIFRNLTGEHGKFQISFSIEKANGGARLVAIIPEIMLNPNDIEIMRNTLSPEGAVFKRVLFTNAMESQSRHYNLNMVQERLFNPLDHRERIDRNSAYGIVMPLYTMNYQGLQIESPLKDWWTGEVITTEYIEGQWEENELMFSSSMGESESLRRLFEYCFPVLEYATLANIHEMETNMKNINIVSHFGGTRDALYSVFFAVTPQQNNWQKQPKPLQDLAAGLGVSAMFPGQINQLMDANTALLSLACTRMKWNFGLDVCWGNPFNGMGFGFILKAATNAALKVLKDWIEKNDPNIKLAKHLSFLSQLACVDIPTTATSGLIHATFPLMSTQFTAMYNALGLGDLQGGADSDSDEGEKAKQQIEEAGLTLPNYCGENDRAAGDLSLDASAERGQRIERVAQLLRVEDEYRENVILLTEEINQMEEVLAALHAEIDRQNRILNTHVRNPFSTSTTPVQDENFPDLVQHRIDTSREVTVEGRKRLREERDKLKGEILLKREELTILQDELQFLDENRNLVGDFVR